MKRRPFPRICLIGAGISGLLTGKALQERDLSYDCYEKSSIIGGNWAFRNPNNLSSAYRSLHIDTSRGEIELPDFPMPADYPDFPHHSQINAYLNELADHFGLRDAIHFNTSVERAYLRPDGSWRVALDSGDVHDYDALIVATGHHWDPYLPEFPGHFAGDIIHSHDYVDAFEPLELRGRRVLIVGIGNSAVDIACELSTPSLAHRVVLSTRRGAYVVPKYVFGRPADQILRSYPYIPYTLQRRFAALLLQLAVGRVENYGMPTPDHAFLDAHPTVSSELLPRVAHDLIEIRPDVAELQGDQVRFVDGRTEPFDAIIYATGYNVTLPFMDEAFLDVHDNCVSLFKRIFLPGVDNLLFVGFAQPLPSLIRFVQDQVEMVAAYLAGEYALPPKSEMEQIIERDERLHGGHYVASRRHTMQVDQKLYAHEMKRELSRGRRRAQGKAARPPTPLLVGLAAAAAGLLWWHRG